MILPQEIIRRKRGGAPLRAEEIEAFVRGLTNGSVSDAQASALAMAIFFNGMDRDECAALTLAMARSGTLLDWRAAKLPGPAIDKHSTGGVGDLVSLILAPAAAACGLYVPMIAGRGLGHTGGTIDKLESIPGYTTQPGKERFIDVVRRCGCAIIGQTADLAPADRKLYAIRDVTATVESIPLITASILSKKLAAGLEGLVLDVKTGSGAFLPSPDDARELVGSLLEVGARLGLPVRVLVTDMNEPLASSAGNALEVMAAIDFLTGTRTDPRLQEVVLQLGVEMLRLADKTLGADEAARSLQKAIASGAAAERFGKMASALGAPSDLMERPRAHLTPAAVIRPVYPRRRGHVVAIDVRALGLCVVHLGGGRRAAGAAIDPSVGLSMLARIGAFVDENAPICMAHACDEAAAAAAAEMIAGAYRVADEPSALAAHPLITRITS
ncbi:thymidine phosphorylase [Methylocapsa palsarum]|uniref:Thymidine phosphorylase n=1 Tax=Methylocapsa palsarum TaxID=1612308 RepID=A0A1I3Z8L2_9HYPH|nr:thymidine phosphorylase [Methylocapsa palsarum]SFK40343.1 thymidine phosphorylase [Methylocapsa palsarum]